MLIIREGARSWQTANMRAVPVTSPVCPGQPTLRTHQRGGWRLRAQASLRDDSGSDAVLRRRKAFLFTLYLIHLVVMTTRFSALCYLQETIKYENRSKLLSSCFVYFTLDELHHEDFQKPAAWIYIIHYLQYGTKLRREWAGTKKVLLLQSI
jgi:hypothetical protein